MPKRNAVALVAGALILLAAALLMILPRSATSDLTSPVRAEHGGGSVMGAVSEPSSAMSAADRDGADARLAVDASLTERTGVRGRMVFGRDGQPVVGAVVQALREPPSVERLLSRLRGLLRRGLWIESVQAPAILGRAVTAADGTFEILGLPPGQVFLDGRASTAFVRTPRAVRLARGEIRDGITLVAAPGGGVDGIVLQPDGQPAAGAVVSLRPGLNAFFGQLTQRKCRWFETVADDEGRFEMPGVPTGHGWTVAAVHPAMALEEVLGVSVTEGRTTHVDVQGHPGALLAGKVVDPEGAPVANAQVALVYLDIGRALFSADGRAEPLTTDAEGTFRVPRVAAGEVALTAVADGFAPAEIVELTTVDEAVFDGIRLVLGGGRSLAGVVVDDDDRPVGGARIVVRPFEPPTDPHVARAALGIRAVETQSGAEGTFVARGIGVDRVLVEAGKPGFVTVVHTAVRVPAANDSAADGLRLQLVRGGTVRGRVLTVAGEPVPRFRVRVRPRAAEEDAGPRGWRGFQRTRTMHLREGEQLGDHDLDGGWDDVGAEDGRFVLRGVPPGTVQVQVRAEGYLRPRTQTIELVAGQETDELRFELRAGLTVRGEVRDAASGQPVADAQVTADRVRDDEDGRRGPFHFDVEFEDFDFLALSANTGRSSDLTDAHGRFAIEGLEAGTLRLTARHPDLAKSSAVEVVLVEDSEPADVVLELGGGGAIEGLVTGAGRAALPDAIVVAFSLSAGACKSASTDAAGRYRIDGLPAGQYVVFKSRLRERAFNLGYDLLGNMRLRNVAVRDGAVTPCDIADEQEGTALVYGTVREGGQPVARAIVSALSADSDGVLGIGIRAEPTDDDGVFELSGMKPGSYSFQVTRFRGRPQQASLAVDVPDGVARVRVDLDLPQGALRGDVVDAAGQPLSGIVVRAGVEDGGVRAPGLLGAVLRNSLARDRTDTQGRFELTGLAPGVYRLTASGRERRRGDGEPRYGDGILAGLRVDGATGIDDLRIVLPRAGSVEGVVVDGNGDPVAGAQVTSETKDAPRRADDLFGLQLRPVRSDAAGRFVIEGLTPGRYRVLADVEGLAPGVADDVVVVAGQPTLVELRATRGATVRVRVTNAQGQRIPPARLTVLNGSGEPVVRPVSVFAALRRLVGRRSDEGDAGWYEVGAVPPDTYTLVVEEEGRPPVRLMRTIGDGETVEWDIDLAAELANRGR